MRISRNQLFTASLLLCLLLAAILRLYGIEWGLPDATHPIASYHPDEVPTLVQAEWFREGVYRPQQFVFGGTLFFTVVGAFLRLGHLLSPVLQQFNFTADVLLASRYFMVVVAMVTLLLVYEGTRILRDEKLAMVATFILAIMPAHVILAQQMRPDEIAGLLVALQYFLAAKILKTPHERTARNLLWLSALLGGLMLAFRFPLLLFAGMPMLAWLLRVESGFWQQCWRRMLPTIVPVCLLLIALGYVICSPQTFSHFIVFKAGMQMQWNFQSSPFPDAIGRGPVAFQYWWGMLHQALGYPLYFVAVVGVGLLLRRRLPGDWLLLGGLLPYMLMVSLTTWVVVRYTLPLLPLLAVVIAELAMAATRKLGTRVVIPAMSVIVAVTLWALLAYLHMEAGPNVRALTYEWVDQHIPPGQCILMVKAYEAEEMYNPEFNKTRCNGVTTLDTAPDFVAIFANDAIKYVLLHEQLYANMERLGSAHPNPNSRGFYKAMMDAGFTVMHEERSDPILLGGDFSSWFTSMDMTYVNPGFRVYQRPDGLAASANR
jgi:hypothetical protein